MKVLDYLRDSLSLFCVSNFSPSVTPILNGLEQGVFLLTAPYSLFGVKLY